MQSYIYNPNRVRMGPHKDVDKGIPSDRMLPKRNNLSIAMFRKGNTRATALTNVVNNTQS